MVYCGGLENRFGLTADGGSNPSLSAILVLVASLIFALVIWAIDLGFGGALGWFYREF